MKLLFELLRVVVEMTVVLSHRARQEAVDVLGALQLAEDLAGRVQFRLAPFGLGLLLRLGFNVPLPFPTNLARFFLHKAIEALLLLVAPPLESIYILFYKLLARALRRELIGYFLNLLVVVGGALVDAGAVAFVVFAQLALRAF